MTPDDQSASEKGRRVHLWRRPQTWKGIADRRDWCAAVLALGSVLAGLVFVILPPNFSRSEIVWEPETAADYGTLILSRSAPERFEVETSCEKVRAADPAQPLISAGTIVLSVVEDDLVLAADPTSEPVRVPLPDGSCEVVGRYDRASSSVTLTVGESTAVATTTDPRVTGLVSQAAVPAVDRVVIRTQPTALATSWLRWIVGLISLALAVASLALVVGRRARDQRAPARNTFPRPVPVDGAVLVSLVLLALVVPALFDDGWILVRSLRLVEDGWFGNLYTTNDAWLAQGFLHEGALGAMQQWGARFVHLRLAMAVGLTASWVILRHYVLVPILGRSTAQHVVAAAVFTAFSGAWLITVRAEPVVVMLGTLTLAACLSMYRRPQPILVAVGIITGALTIGAHQSGWVALGPVLFLLHATARAAFADRRLIPGYLTAVTASGTVGVLTVFAGIDLRNALDGAREFALSADYSGGILSEPGRYTSLFNGDYTGARGFTALLLAALAMSAAASIGTDPWRRRLWLVSLAWLGGLLLTSSKWPWHLGVYAVPATIFAALTAAAWHREHEGRTGLGRAAVLAMVTLLAGMALAYGGRWGDGDLSTLAWADLSELVVGESRRPWWYLVVLGVVVLGVLADRGRLQRIATAVLALAIVTPLLVNMAWVVKDATAPGWSFTGSTIRQVSGDDGCGALDNQEMVVDADALPETEPLRPGGATDGQSLAPNGFPGVQGLTTGPLEGELEAWGTWFTNTTDQGPDAQVGTMPSPEYSLSGTRDVTVWTAAGTLDGIAVRAVFSSGEVEVGQSALPVAAAPIWALHTLDPPAGADSVRLEVDDNATAYGGWAAVSVPAEVETAPASSVFEDATGYTSPFRLTQFPCVPVPGLNEGFWEKIDYAVKTDYYYDASPYHGLTATQVLCAAGQDCITKLDYELADIAVTELR